MNATAIPLEPRARPLAAPIRHTLILVAILLAIAAYGAYSQYAGSENGALPEHRDSALPLYLSLIAAQGLLLRFVLVGIRKTGTRLSDLLGERWRGWKDVARDAAIALVVWAAWTGLSAAADHFLGNLLGSDPAKSISSLLPRGPIEGVVWVALSISAGFCEEVVFRGYLQRQFEAITGNPLLGVAAQAVIFGVSHGYQGVRNVITITIFGLIFGLLAWRRRSLKPGILLHAWTDIFSGLVARG